MIITVLGSRGFLGCNLTEHLLVKGHSVIGIDSLTYCSVEDFNPPFNSRYRFIESDINDLDYLPACDVVINAAAHTHVDNSIASQKEFIHSNFNGIVHILELIRNKPSFDRPHFLQISTDEVYGDEPPLKGFKETSELKPSSPYASSKAAADIWILGYCKTFDIKYGILRLTNMYGHYQFPEKLIPKTFRSLDRNQLITLYGDGSYKRYWLHVEDAVNAILKAATQKLEGIYNVSGDIVLQNKRVIELCIREYLQAKSYNSKQTLGEKTPEYEKMNQFELLDEFCLRVPNRLAEDKIYRINDDKFKKETKWKPEKHFGKSINELASWFYKYAKSDLR